MTDLVIVSMHEKGFPLADMYRDAAEIPNDEFAAMGIAPDDFMTFVRGSTIHDAMEAAKKRWPGAFIVTVFDDEDDDEGDD